MVCVSQIFVVRDQALRSSHSPSTIKVIMFYDVKIFLLFKGQSIYRSFGVVILFKNQKGENSLLIVLSCVWTQAHNHCHRVPGLVHTCAFC